MVKEFKTILQKIFIYRMKILLKQAAITDTGSPYHNTIRDILIEDGKIIKIADNINETADTVVNTKDLLVSTGWVDVFANFCDPGYEYKETLETGAAAATAGGYTQVFVVPNNNPVVQNKTQVEYIVQKSRTLSSGILPIGAVTKNCEGKDLSEMYDMRMSGAVAFSDGLLPVQTSGLLLKALQYVKAFDGTIIQVPVDSSIGTYGLMNEGLVSTRLGLPGIPAIGEEIIIKRDIDLLRYTESKLHITGVSTAKGLALIKTAKEEGLAISCSVTPYHLFYCDEDLQEYDANLKVNPPLRTKEDMLALRKGVIDGVVDCIASHHFPQDWDHKTCEFEFAKYGMLSLQTTFAVVNNILPGLSNEQIANLFSNNARNIFALPPTSITEGANAELTLFSKTGKTTLTKESNKSKSTNSPFFNKELNGVVIGTINKGQLFLN